MEIGLNTKSAFTALLQSQKTQGFCVADFATLPDERRSRSKIFPLFIWIKEPYVRKFEGLERSKLLGISQTILMRMRNVGGAVGVFTRSVLSIPGRKILNRNYESLYW